MTRGNGCILIIPLASFCFDEEKQVFWWEDYFLTLSRNFFSSLPWHQILCCHNSLPNSNWTEKLGLVCTGRVALRQRKLLLTELRQCHFGWLYPACALAVPEASQEQMKSYFMHYFLHWKTVKIIKWLKFIRIYREGVQVFQNVCY